MTNMFRFACLLACVVAAFPCAAQQPPEVSWRVSAQFPQVRSQLTPARWVSPAIADGPAGAQDALPRPDESWEDWYARVSAPGKSPLAAVIFTNADVWNEPAQAYDPEFLKYIRSDEVFVRLSLPAGLPEPRVCRWEIEGAASVVLGCRNIEVSLPTTKATRVSLFDGSTLIAQSSVQPRRLRVLGLGDSYAAGEGNPDVPTQWKPGSVLPDGVREGSVASLNWLRYSAPGTSNRYVAAGARWRDRKCHRSFWNQQTFSAMRLAAQDPHREVDFLHFACSGAEILDGLIVRQLDAPGAGGRNKNGCKNGQDPACRIGFSQLAAATAALCRQGSGPASLAPDLATMEPIDTELKKHLTGWKKLDAYRRPGAHPRFTAPYGLDLRRCDELAPADLVLLSLGGNDAGFAGLVTWALFPANRPFIQEPIRWMGVICPASDPRSCQWPRADMYALQLQQRYALFGKALQGSHLVRNKEYARVVLSSYPNPALTGRIDATGRAEVCSDPAGKPRPWEALNVVVPPLLLRQGTWDFRLRTGETSANGNAARELSDTLIPAIRRSLKSSAQSLGYTYAAATESAFNGRSWCNESVQESARLGLPSDHGTGWNHDASSWRPFASRARAIRTANDSFMTQLSTISGDINGTMHPTAEGHMLLAEGVFAELEKLEPASQPPNP